MPNYKYRGVSRTGDPVTGKLTAKNELDLEDKLAESGAVLIEIMPAEEKGIGKKEIQIFKPTVKDRELIELFSTLQGLLKAGVPLLDSLTTVAKEIENQFFRQTLEDVTNSLEAGNLFCESIEDHPRVFSDYIVGMVTAGEQSGNLPDTFKELIRYLEWQATLKANIKQATIYPISICIALIGFITVLFTFVVPKFVKLLTGINVALPMPTRVVMLISDAFVSYWWVMLILVISAVVVYKYGLKHWEKFGYTLDKLKFNIAIFGPVIKMITISRFAQNFSVLLKSGISIIENLELCQKLVGNKVMEAALREAVVDISGGMPLNESLRKHDLFSAKEMLMITVGETAGDIGGALGNIADHYNEEIPRNVKKIFSIIEPLITLALISIVGFTALAIFLPILSMFGGAR